MVIAALVSCLLAGCGGGGGGGSEGPATAANGVTSLPVDSTDVNQGQSGMIVADVGSGTTTSTDLTSSATTNATSAPSTSTSSTGTTGSTGTTSSTSSTGTTGSTGTTSSTSTTTVATSTDTTAASADTTLTAQSVTVANTCYNLPALPTVPTTALKVTDFGAIPNDNLPDDDAIAAALAALKPGQWLVFPPGRYIQSKSIYVKTANVVLWGNGATIHATNTDDQTIGLAASGASIYNFTLTADTATRGTAPRHARISVYPLTATTGFLSGNVIRNNTITYTATSPNGAAAAGIFVFQAKDFTIAGNTVRRTLADGIHITAGSYNGKVLNNTVAENGDDMIALVSYMGAGWQTQVKADASYASSVWSKRVHDVYVSGNSVSGNYWGRGLTVVGAQNITLLNNTVDRITRAAGILIGQEASYNTFGNQNILVKGNTITNIQTTTAAYVPTSMALKIATTAVTGHGGIEIYNYGNSATDAADATLKPYIMSDRIRLESNKITNVVRDGVRIGVSTAAGLIGANTIQSTTFKTIKQYAINNVLASTAKSYCTANLLEGTNYANAAACLATSSATVTGATLDCTGNLK